MPKGIPGSPKTHVCEACGGVFDSWATHSRVKYCTTSCKEKARYKRDREKRKKAVQDYREKNPEKVRLSAVRSRDKKGKSYTSNLNRVQYLKNREARIATSIQYQKDNPDVVARRNAKRKAAVSYNVSSKDLRTSLNRTGSRCTYCSTKLDLDNRKSVNGLHWDHVIPLSRGGNNGIGNIVPTCAHCNLTKQSSTIMEWRLRGSGDPVIGEILALVIDAFKESNKELKKSKLKDAASKLQIRIDDVKQRTVRFRKST